LIILYCYRLHGIVFFFPLNMIQQRVNLDAFAADAAVKFSLQLSSAFCVIPAVLYNHMYWGRVTHLTLRYKSGVL